ncbi:MAG: ankyrin repeat domain-containing protein [archaeon]|nr:ankyrin repeat domain-containing protein [archaeon]
MAEPVVIKKNVDKVTAYKYITEKEGDKASFKEFWKNIRISDYDLDEIDEQQNKTALMGCLNLGIPDKAWVLLEFFADPNIQNKDGKTALHFAVEEKKKDFQFLLLLFGADVNIQDKEEKTPYQEDTDYKDIKEVVDKFKDTFLFMTRKRRKYLRYIFQKIESNGNTPGFIDQNSLAKYYVDFYQIPEQKAYDDAALFVTECAKNKIDKEDKDNVSMINFEEFMIAMLKIAKYKGLDKLDEFIGVFKNAYQREKQEAKDAEAQRLANKNKEQSE